MNSIALSSLQGRVRELLGREIAFIHSAEFNSKQSQHRILNEMPPAEDYAAEKNLQPVRPPEDLPAYFASLYQHPLLTAAQETHLFRRMNFLKFRANALRSALKPQTASEATLDEIDRMLAAAQKIRDEIIQANMRLVVALARKYSNTPQSFEDLLSDGHLALIRAVEKFNYSRGFRFSTYATHAIQRDFFRQLNRQQKDSARFEEGVDRIAERSENEAEEDVQAAEDFRRYQSLLKAMQSQLDGRDRRVVMLRFGIDSEEGPQTLQTIGLQLGLSKERVRQLEIRAIEKLKNYAEGK